jgi:hypothetical protein
LKARGNVEDWLGKVEEAMFSNLRKLVKGAITDYENRPRKEWVVYLVFLKKRQSFDFAHTLKLFCSNSFMPSNLSKSPSRTSVTSNILK